MTSFVDNGIELPWSEVWDKVPEGNTLISADTQMPIIHSVG